MLYTIEDLKKFDDYYYNKKRPIISDEDYDRIKRELRELFPNDPYFASVSKPVVPLPKTIIVNHEYILGSPGLETEETIWRRLDKLVDNDIIIYEKIDGVSVLFHYEEGKLVKAVTKGDGTRGQDITEKVRRVAPPINNSKDKVLVIGEIFLKGEDHLKMGFDNRRSIVEIIRLGDHPSFRTDLVQVKLTELIYPDNIQPESNRLLYLRNVFEKKYIVDYYKMKVIDPTSMKDFLIHLINQNKNKNYDLDGLIIIQDFGRRENTTSPSKKFCFKLDESPPVPVTVEDVEWVVIKDGIIFPILHVKRTLLQGSYVDKVSGYSANYIEENGIGEGSEIGIGRVSGQAFPVVKEIYKKSKYVKMPEQCPNCNKPLERSGPHLVCLNPECASIKYSELVYFFKTLGAETLSEKIFKILGVEDLHDVLNINLDDILEKKEFQSRDGKSLAENIYKDIRDSLQATAEDVIVAFGIPSINRDVARKILSKYTLEELFEEESEDFTYDTPRFINLMEIDGISHKVQEEYLLYKNVCTKILRILFDRGLKIIPSKETTLEEQVSANVPKIDVKSLPKEPLVTAESVLGDRERPKFSFAPPEPPTPTRTEDTIVEEKEKEGVEKQQQQLEEGDIIGASITVEERVSPSEEWLPKKLSKPMSKKELKFPNVKKSKSNISTGEVLDNDNVDKEKSHSFCLIGFSPYPKSEIEKKLDSLGHSVIKTVRKDLDFLVVDDLSKDSTKKRRAMDYGIKIITYQQLIEKFSLEFNKS